MDLRNALREAIDAIAHHSASPEDGRYRTVIDQECVEEWRATLKATG